MNELRWEITALILHLKLLLLSDKPREWERWGHPCPIVWLNTVYVFEQGTCRYSWKNAKTYLPICLTIGQLFLILLCQNILEFLISFSLILQIYISKYLFLCLAEKRCHINLKKELQNKTQTEMQGKKYNILTYWNRLGLCGAKITLNSKINEVKMRPILFINIAKNLLILLEQK